MTGLVKGHAYSVTAVEEVKQHHEINDFRCHNMLLTSLLLTYSVDRLSRRTLKSVWCASGTRGVRWNGTAPGVTSEES